MFYSNGVYGMGPGTATRDVFIGRESANTVFIAGSFDGSTTAGNLHVVGNTIVNAQLRLNDSDASNYVAIDSPGTVAANWTLTLPTTAGTASYVMTTDGSGNASWSQVSLTAGVTGDLPFANLAQGSALSVLGVTGNATADVASIAAGSDYQVLRRSGTSLAFGAVNLASANAVTGLLPIANMSDLAGLSVLGRSANSSGVMAAITATATGQVLRYSGTTIGFGALDLADTDAITGDLPFSNLTQGSARSVLGVSGNSTADVASIQGSANQVLCVNNAGTAIGFATDVISITYVIDGGGSAIATGIKGDITIPFACTITEWTLLADASGSIVVDIWKDTYANYPPVVGDAITGSAKPTISAATKGQSSTLTGWTTSVAAGDTLRFNVDSASTVTRVTLSLKCTKQRS
jgi:hypothetical protein